MLSLDARGVINLSWPSKHPESVDAVYSLGPVVLGKRELGEFCLLPYISVTKGI